MKKRILVLGNISSNFIFQVDKIPDDDTTIYMPNEEFDTLFYGGTGLNIAYNLAKLQSNEITVLTSTDKKYGLKVLNALKELSVNTDYVQIVDAKRTCYIIEDQNKRRLTILAGKRDDPPVMIPDGLFENQDLIVFSIDHKENVDNYLNKLLECGADFAFSMRSDVKIFNDDFLKKCCPNAKIIFCNEHEKEVIEKALNIVDISELFDIGKTEIICVTKGSDGSDLYQKHFGKDYRHIGIVKPNCIEDCTGAGDAFVAGFIYGYSKDYDLLECARLGATLSSFIIEKIGCVSNSPDEELLIKRYNDRNEV